jgi:hypothetical protein
MKCKRSEDRMLTTPENIGAHSKSYQQEGDVVSASIRSRINE